MTEPDQAPAIEVVPRYRSPIGRGIYLKVLDVLPPDKQPALRSVATLIRRQKTAVRLFRERWVRRSKRAVRRTHFRWLRVIRRVNRLSRGVRRTWHRPPPGLVHQRRTAMRVERWRRRESPRFGSRQPWWLRSESARAQLFGREDVSRYDVQSTFSRLDRGGPARPRSGNDEVDFRPRSKLTRRFFPPTVPLVGDGDVVLVNAIGHPIHDVLDRAHHFGERWIVVTDDPHIGPLRAQRLLYEYVPADADDGLNRRIRWFDYVYGIDAVMNLSDLPGIE